MARSADDPKKGRDKKLPTGKEIMKRRTPNDLSLRPARFEFDPKKAYTTEQLAEIGAITLKWNQIEAHIEFVATFILFTKSPFWLRLSINVTYTPWEIPYHFNKEIRFYSRRKEKGEIEWLHKPLE